MTWSATAYRVHRKSWTPCQFGIGHLYGNPDTRGIEAIHCQTGMRDKPGVYALKLRRPPLSPHGDAGDGYHPPGDGSGNADLYHAGTVERWIPKDHPG